MNLKGKEIRSKASSLTGYITGVEKDRLKVTFTKFQDVSVPLIKAEDLLIMDEETVEEIRKLIRSLKPDKTKKRDSAVRTYIDDYEEEKRPVEEEEPGPDDYPEDEDEEE